MRVFYLVEYACSAPTTDQTAREPWYVLIAPIFSQIQQNPVKMFFFFPQRVANEKALSGECRVRGPPTTS